MAKTQILQRFIPGQSVTVTNHYITRPDHPCYGTHPRVVTRVTSSHLWFTNEAGQIGNVPWPKKAADLRIDGDAVQLWGYPSAGDLFLTIELR